MKASLAATLAFWLMTSAPRNGGSRVSLPPFLTPVLRLMHVHFTLQPHTDASREAFQQLARYPVTKASCFILHACKAEEPILKTIAERTPVHEKTLDANPSVKHFRLIKNHAQLMALVEALAHVVEMRPETIDAVHTEIVRMAAERQQAINADHPKVQEFWEVFDYIEDRTTPDNKLNHSRKDGVVALNLNEFVAKADAYRQPIPDMNEIKKLLRTSRTRKFVNANVTVNSAVSGKSVKCWVFQEDPAYRPADD